MKVHVVCFKCGEHPSQVCHESKVFLDKESAQYYADELTNDIEDAHTGDKYVVESMKVADGR